MSQVVSNAYYQCDHRLSCAAATATKSKILSDNIGEESGRIEASNPEP